MIAKAKSIIHGGKGIDYALNKDQAEIIDKRFVVGDNGQEIKEEFRMFQDLNTRAKNNDLSFVLSPEPKDGKRLTNSDFKELSDSFLKKMGLDKHQAIVIKHVDKEHAHLHIFANRIDHNGKAYKDNFISKESQRVADKVAQEKGLTRAQNIRDFNKAQHKDLKKEIFTKHEAVLSGKPKDFKSYCEGMRSSGVKIIPTINNGGNLQGFRVEFKGKNLKASEINRSMTLSKMGVNTKQISKAVGLSVNLNPALKIGLKIAKMITKEISRGI